MGVQSTWLPSTMTWCLSHVQAAHFEGARVDIDIAVAGSCGAVSSLYHDGGTRFRWPGLTQT